MLLTWGPHGAEVFNHAFSLAKQYDAKIHVVHALEPMSDYAQSLVETFVPPDTLKALHQDGFEQVHQEMRRRLEKFCEDSLHPEAKTVVADMRVVEGHPAQVIVDEAQRIGADLIVLGSHGQTALGEMLIGSVAHKVLMKARHPGIPVFLVPIDRIAEKQQSNLRRVSQVPPSMIQLPKKIDGNQVMMLGKITIRISPTVWIATKGMIPL